MSNGARRYTAHQPTLFPPVYLAARFASVDTVVWLGRDTCKPGYDGWHTQFKLDTPLGPIVVPAWLKDRKGKTIDEVEFDRFDRWHGRLLKTLGQHYRKAPNFEGAMGMVEGLKAFAPGFSSVCKAFTTSVFVQLGVLDRFVEEQSLGIPRPEDASQWLADIGTAINCSHYVCAADATSKYLDPAPFEAAGLSLSPQKFSLPRHYGVSDASVSTLDLLFRGLPEDLAARY